jgi:WD40 repeat protein
MLDTDDSKQGFFDHKDSVFTIALSQFHPNLALTGDGDNQAFLWYDHTALSHTRTLSDFEYVVICIESIFTHVCVMSLFFLYLL